MFSFASWLSELQGFKLHSAPRLEQATKSSPKDRTWVSCERRLTNCTLLKNRDRPRFSRVFSRALKKLEARTNSIFHWYSSLQFEPGTVRAGDRPRFSLRYFSHIVWNKLSLFVILFLCISMELVWKSQTECATVTKVFYAKLTQSLKGILGRLILHLFLLFLRFSLKMWQYVESRHANA